MKIEGVRALPPRSECACGGGSGEPDSVCPMQHTSQPGNTQPSLTCRVGVELCTALRAFAKRSNGITVNTWECRALGKRSNGLTVTTRVFRTGPRQTEQRSHRHHTGIPDRALGKRSNGLTVTKRRLPPPKDSPRSPTYQSGTPVRSSLKMDGPTSLHTKGPYHASCSGFAVGARREPGRSGGGVAHPEGQKSAPPGHAQPSGDHHH